MTNFANAQDCSITFVIKGLKNNDGQVLISLFSSEEKFMEDYSMGKVEKNLNGDQVSITYEGLQPGEYAASAFHDENSNGKLDTNFMGIPKEAYGFSNDARGTFGPPSYEDCKFIIKSGNTVHEITLK